jgi:hypothetical protein
MAVNMTVTPPTTANGSPRQCRHDSDGRWPAARLAFTDESLAGMA